MRTKLKILTLTFSVIAAGNAGAQKTRDVEGHAEFYLPRNVSRAVGEQQVLDMARIDALAREFGTVIRQDIQMDTHVDDRGESSDWWSSNSALVKGEWLETTGQPAFGIRLEGDDIVLTCDVRGKARELKGQRADLDILLLRNGVTDDCVTNTFVDGEKCFMAFTAPVNGYLAIYLEDADRNMIRMLPFPAERIAARPVKADERYVFFVSNEGFNEQYRMTTERPSERNVIHVVFSPNGFMRPTETAAGDDPEMRQVSVDKFHKWFAKARAADPDLQEVLRPFTITSAHTD